MVTAQKRSHVNSNELRHCAQPEAVRTTSNSFTLLLYISITSLTRFILISDWLNSDSGFLRDLFGCRGLGIWPVQLLQVSLLEQLIQDLGQCWMCMDIELDILKNE